MIALVDENTLTFATDGFMVMESLFDPSMIELMSDVVMKSFHALMQIIAHKKLSFGTGIKNGFKEIVQRHPLRFEMPYQMDDARFNFVAESSTIRQLVSNVLQCEDYIIANRSVVVSLPGCDDQSWHSDGPHMSATEDLPCHCLNVFVPLVDINESNGPTEFRPGSHFYTRDLAKSYLLALAKKSIRPIQRPHLKKGSALMFDYRILHRGAANSSSFPRPILVFTFAKPWYKDVLNFPARSILEDPAQQEQGLRTV